MAAAGQAGGQAAVGSPRPGSLLRPVSTPTAANSPAAAVGIHTIGGSGGGGVGSPLAQFERWQRWRSDCLAELGLLSAPAADTPSRPSSFASPSSGAGAVAEAADAALAGEANRQRSESHATAASSSSVSGGRREGRLASVLFANHHPAAAVGLLPLVQHQQAPALLLDPLAAAPGDAASSAPAVGGAASAITAYGPPSMLLQTLSALASPSRRPSALTAEPVAASILLFLQTGLLTACDLLASFALPPQREATPQNLQRFVDAAVTAARGARGTSSGPGTTQPYTGGSDAEHEQASQGAGALPMEPSHISLPAPAAAQALWAFFPPSSADDLLLCPLLASYVTEDAVLRSDLTGFRDALLASGQFVNDAAARQSEFKRLICDQRSREGRLFQRWCQRVFAPGFTSSPSIALGFASSPAQAIAPNQSRSAGGADSESSSQRGSQSMSGETTPASPDVGNRRSRRVTLQPGGMAHYASETNNNSIDSEEPIIGEYAFDLLRYLDGFDPGLEFFLAAARKEKLHISAIEQPNTLAGADDGPVQTNTAARSSVDRAEGPTAVSSPLTASPRRVKGQQDKVLSVQVIEGRLRALSEGKGTLQVTLEVGSFAKTFGGNAIPLDSTRVGGVCSLAVCGTLPLTVSVDAPSTPCSPASRTASIAGVSNGIESTAAPFSYLSPAKLGPNASSAPKRKHRLPRASPGVPIPRAVEAFTARFAFDIVKEHHLDSSLMEEPSAVSPSGLAFKRKSKAAVQKDAPSRTEACRIMKSYLTRVLAPRLHSFLFAGYDVIVPEESMPVSVAAIQEALNVESVSQASSSKATAAPASRTELAPSQPPSVHAGSAPISQSTIPASAPPSANATPPGKLSHLMKGVAEKNEKFKAHVTELAQNVAANVQQGMKHGSRRDSNTERISTEVGSLAGSTMSHGAAAPTVKAEDVALLGIESRAAKAEASLVARTVTGDDAAWTGNGGDASAMCAVPSSIADVARPLHPPNVPKSNGPPLLQFRLWTEEIKDAFSSPVTPTALNAGDAGLSRAEVGTPLLDLSFDPITLPSSEISLPSHESANVHPPFPDRAYDQNNEMATIGTNGHPPQSRMPVGQRNLEKERQFTLVLPNSAAELLQRRDKLWSRQQPKVQAMSFRDIGVPEAFSHSMERDKVSFRIPFPLVPRLLEELEIAGDKQLAAAVLHALSSRTDAAVDITEPQPPSADAHEFHSSLHDTREEDYLFVHVQQHPFHIAIRLLNCIDGLTIPAHMLQCLSAAVKALELEASARAATFVLQKWMRTVGTALGSDESKLPSIPTPPPVASEDLVPLLVYALSRTTWRRPFAALSFITNYASVSGMDEFIVTTVYSSLVWICSDKIPAAKSARTPAADRSEQVQDRSMSRPSFSAIDAALEAATAAGSNTPAPGTPPIATPGVTQSGILSENQVGFDSSLQLLVTQRQQHPSSIGTDVGLFGARSATGNFGQSDEEDQETTDPEVPDMYALFDDPTTAGVDAMDMAQEIQSLKLFLDDQERVENVIRMII